MMIVKAMSARPKRRVPRAFSQVPLATVVPRRKLIPSAAIAVRLPVEGGAQQALLCQIRSIDDVDDLLLVKHIDPVAEEELVVLGRVPEEAAP